jgi:hypothetical protein
VHLEPIDPEAYPEAPRHYGLLLWNNNDGIMRGVPTDALWAWGFDGELIFMIQSLDLAVARGGPKIEPHAFGDIPPLEPLFSPIARSVIRKNAAPRPDAGPDRRLSATGSPRSTAGWSRTVCRATASR